VAIEAVIDQVKQALADVQNQLSSADLPPLNTVTLTLQTVAAKQDGVSVKLWVISLGGKWEKDSTQEITIVLTPPRPGGARNVSTENLTKSLEEAIVSAAQGLKKAGRSPNALILKSLDVTLSFTVKTGVNGDANVQILPLGPDLSGALNKTAVQTLKLSFGLPAAKDSDK
jgi:hypothetical protein